jgi:hypothetical protein
MKKSELKEMIKAAFLAEKADGDVVDPYMAEGEEDLDELLARLSEETELDEIDDFEANANRIMAKNKDLADKKSVVKQAEEDYKAGKISNEEFAKIIQNNQYINKEEVVAEAEEEEDVKVKVKVDAEDLGDEIDAADTDLSADDEEVETANDSIVVDKKIVSLSSLPSATRKILDTLETLRAEAEEFGDQKFITQVGNTITFFTRDFVVAGDAPNPQGIEEGDGELDVNIDSEKSTAEMEAGLGLEETTFPMWNKIK